jgi:predicted GNAT family acetyltransferase
MLSVALKVRRPLAFSMLNSKCLSTVPGESSSVQHNVARKEFILEFPGHAPAFLRYRQEAHGFDLYTTVVPQSLEGRGIAKLLANAAFDHAVKEQWRVKLSCWYLSGYLKRHPRDDVLKLVVS